MEVRELAEVGILLHSGITLRLSGFGKYLLYHLISSSAALLEDTLKMIFLPGMVVYAFNPISQEVEASEL